MTTYARSSVDRALLCDGRGRWFDSAGRASCGCSSVGRAPGSQPREARSTRVVAFSQARGVTGHCGSNLAGRVESGGRHARSSRARAAGYLGRGSLPPAAPRSSKPHPTANHDRDIFVFGCRPERISYLSHKGPSANSDLQAKTAAAITGRNSGSRESVGESQESGFKSCLRPSSTGGKAQHKRQKSRPWFINSRKEVFAMSYLKRGPAAGTAVAPFQFEPGGK